MTRPNQRKKKTKPTHQCQLCAHKPTVKAYRGKAKKGEGIKSKTADGAWWLFGMFMAYRAAPETLFILFNGTEIQLPFVGAVAHSKRNEAIFVLTFWRRFSDQGQPLNEYRYSSADLCSHYDMNNSTPFGLYCGNYHNFSKVDGKGAVTLAELIHFYEFASMTNGHISEGNVKFQMTEFESSRRFLLAVIKAINFDDVTRTQTGGFRAFEICLLTPQALLTQPNVGTDTPLPSDLIHHLQPYQNAGQPFVFPSQVTPQTKIRPGKEESEMLGASLTFVLEMDTQTRVVFTDLDMDEDEEEELGEEADALEPDARRRRVSSRTEAHSSPSQPSSESRDVSVKSEPEPQPRGPFMVACPNCSHHYHAVDYLACTNCGTFNPMSLSPNPETPLPSTNSTSFTLPEMFNNNTTTFSFPTLTPLASPPPPSTRTDGVQTRKRARDVADAEFIRSLPGLAAPSMFSGDTLLGTHMQPHEQQPNSSPTAPFFSMPISRNNSNSFGSPLPPLFHDSETVTNSSTTDFCLVPFLDTYHRSVFEDDINTIREDDESDRWTISQPDSDETSSSMEVTTDIPPID